MLIYCILWDFVGVEFVRVMTALEMNAEILRNMSIIAEDEALLKRAARYLRKLVAEKQADDFELATVSACHDATGNIVQSRRATTTTTLNFKH